MKKRKGRCLPFSILFLSFLACHDVSPVVPSPEASLNTLSMERVSDFSEASRYRELGRSVGCLAVTLLMKSGEKRIENGTAFIIGSKYVMTARHCLYPSHEDVEKILEIGIEFDYFTGTSEKFSVKSEIKPIKENKEGDWVILELQDIIYRPALKLSDRKPESNEAAFIIHHPYGGPQKISRKDCFAQTSNEKYLCHSCETTQGSSGAPILSAEDFTVIGIHTSGSEGSKFGRRIKEAHDEIQPYSIQEYKTYSSFYKLEPLKDTFNPTAHLYCKQESDRLLTIWETKNGESKYLVRSLQSNVGGYWDEQFQDLLGYKLRGITYFHYTDQYFVTYEHFYVVDGRNRRTLEGPMEPLAKRGVDTVFYIGDDRSGDREYIFYHKGASRFVFLSNWEPLGPNDEFVEVNFFHVIVSFGDRKYEVLNHMSLTPGWYAFKE